jgi:hypothetical protein
LNHCPEQREGHNNSHPDGAPPDEAAGQGADRPRRIGHARAAIMTLIERLSLHRR